jgi:glycosyltransferase involved in cell wall biosynthesis
MNILMVLSAKKYPPDRRVEREAQALIGAGHRVYLMARRGPGQAKEETVDGVHVIRVPLWFQKYKPISDTIYFFMQRYLIFFRILHACRKHRIEVLHVHDLPYAFATVLAGRVLKIPVVFDMHEHYVEMLRSDFNAKQYRKFKPFSFILLGLMALEEKAACRRCRAVIVVAEEHKDRICGLGTKRDCIWEVTNTEEPDDFLSFPIDENIVRNYKQGFVILYIGGFAPIRGLETLIEAMAAVLKAVPEARLLLVGDGCNRQELEELTERLGLSEKVTFTGFAPFEKVSTYMYLSDVCVIPHISTPHVDTTMPNKIFHQMLMGKASVVSNIPPLIRVVEDAQCGLIFEERNAASLAEKIIALKDPALRERLGENGRRAVLEKYNWRQTVQALLELYRQIDKERRQAANAAEQLCRNAGKGG